MRDSFEIAKSLGIQIERTKICGGGAKSLLWKKIIANVLNVKVDVPETEEGPGYGAAILAAVACRVRICGGSGTEAFKSRGHGRTGCRACSEIRRTLRAV